MAANQIASRDITQRVTFYRITGNSTFFVPIPYWATHFDIHVYSSAGAWSSISLWFRSPLARIHPFLSFGAGNTNGSFNKPIVGLSSMYVTATTAFNIEYTIIFKRV